MTGVAFIAKVFNASYTDIAKRLGLTTSTVADWASGRRPVPADKRVMLTKLFRIDEEYFTKKELTEVEKIRIEIDYLQRVSKRDSFELEQTFKDDQGMEHQAYCWYNPYEGDLRFKYHQLECEELFQKIKSIIHQKEDEWQINHRSNLHLQLLRRVARLLEQDRTHDDEQKKATKETAKQRMEISQRVEALEIMVDFVSGGQPLAFGEENEFKKRLFALLLEFEIISL
jgi:transcriptional regulator with XRE-family HTH domain